MTDRQRIRRIQRLLKLSETRRDAAQAALARAQLEVDAATVVMGQAEQRLEDGAERVRRSEGVNAADFADAYAYLRTLRFQVERAREDVDAAQREADLRRGAATGAHREVRKMEIWGESTEERVRVEESRVEQQANDELAARLIGRDT